MKYICAQPSTKYYAWQIDTMLHSFRMVGINLEDVHIVCALHNDIDPYFDRLMKKYLGVIFSFYEDTRHDKNYISSIRPHILKKHFAAYPDLKNETIFYHDSDIVFTKPLSIDEHLKDEVNYMSDTISYIGYDYIKSKGDDVLQTMLDIVGIDEDVVKNNQDSSGGAQYILKDIDKYFWYDVENDSTRLFTEITSLNQKKVAEDPGHHPLQIWCADMWAVLWNLWKRGKHTEVTEALDFSWSVTPANEWFKRPIYHNAGVTESMKNMFYKGLYIDELPPLDLSIGKERCTYMYYKMYQMAAI